jgi:hypothetical protein
MLVQKVTPVAETRVQLEGESLVAMESSQMRLSFSMASLLIALFVLVDVAAIARVIPVKYHDPDTYIFSIPTSDIEPQLP